VPIYDVRLIARALLAYGDTQLSRDLEREADEYYVAAIERLEQAFGPDHLDLLWAGPVTDRVVVRAG
jgi:hypothetical protein